MKYLNDLRDATEWVQKRSENYNRIKGGDFFLFLDVFMELVIFARHYH